MPATSTASLNLYTGDFDPDNWWAELQACHRDVNICLMGHRFNLTALKADAERDFGLEMSDSLCSWHFIDLAEELADMIARLYANGDATKVLRQLLVHEFVETHALSSEEGSAAYRTVMAKIPDFALDVGRAAAEQMKMKEAEAV